MASRLLQREITKERPVRGRGPLLDKRPFHFQPVKGDTGITVRIEFLDRMRHRRDHRTGQTHAIELHHRSLFEERVHLKHLGRLGRRFELPDRQYALVVRFAQSGRVDFDRFAALAGKNAIIYRSRITPRRIQHQVRIVARLLVPFPVDVIRLPKHGPRLQAHLVVTPGRCFELFKPVIERRVGASKNRGRGFLLRILNFLASLF